MNARALAAALFWVLGLAAGSAASAGSYSGIAPGAGVVWVTQSGSAPAVDAAVRQTMKTFVPPVLVVTVGTSVRFPNEDAFYHSVYSESASDPFDLGLYNTGPGKTVLFDQPGIIAIRCHVHGSMHATIVVVDGPFAITTNPNEHYKLGGLTQGAHVLHVWSGGESVAETKIIVK